MYNSFLSVRKSPRSFCQNILVSILTVHVTPVPPQLKSVLLLEPNLTKEVRHSCICGHTGKEIWALRDGIWEDVVKSLGVLNATLKMKISKILSPV